MKIENDLGRDDIRRLVLRLAIPSSWRSLSMCFTAWSIESILEISQ
ncbi:hypothetical protein [Clostridium sp. AF50-3]